MFLIYSSTVDFQKFSPPAETITLASFNLLKANPDELFECDHFAGLVLKGLIWIIIAQQLSELYLGPYQTSAMKLYKYS